MPNITSVTNPAPGQDPNTYRSPITPNDTQIKNIPDPTRVGRTDARTDRQDTASTDVTRRYDSYFQSFLQALRSSGSVSDILANFLISRPGTLVTSGMTAGISQELAQFLQMLQVGPEELLSLLKGELSSAGRFTGPLFDTLRQALRQNPSQGLQNSILQFLKTYNDFSSTPHIEQNMLRTIRQMSWFMPQRFSQPLSEQLSQLENLLGQGNRSGALSLLQNTLIPYMSDYVSKMHDRGIARSLLSLLILDIARYANGSPQNLLQSFYQLLGYSALKQEFGNLSSNELLKLLQNSASSFQQTEHTVADQLAQLSSRALRGDGGADLRQTFQALVDSILVNQSVYMPLAHAMLPVEMNGRMMFSELWVDPDAEQENGREGSSEKCMRLLLKFDVQDLGLFDLVLTYRDGTVDVSLHCPPHLERFSDLFAQKMESMAEKEGLSAASIRASPMSRALTISEVFPKIFERKDSINVTI
ncbi:MAG: hypothetical protein Q3Y08_00075 [Butyricicoccus sp.]|nr:hypothetical protein [Butyricicoccus sp.]